MNIAVVSLLRIGFPEHVDDLVHGNKLAASDSHAYKSLVDILSRNFGYYSQTTLSGYCLSG